MSQSTKHQNQKQEACCQAPGGLASWLGGGLLAIGISGAVVAAICCIAPALLAGLLVAIGLGFILKDAILISLLFIFTGIAVLGYYLIRRHSGGSVAHP